MTWPCCRSQMCLTAGGFVVAALRDHPSLLFDADDEMDLLPDDLDGQEP